MRLPLVILPLCILAGCNSTTARDTSATTASTPPAAPAQPAPVPAATPAPAPVPAAASAPVAKPVSVNLQRFTGPTENADLFGYDDSNSRLFLYSSGTMVLPVSLTAGGDYEIALSAACDEANGELAKFTVAVDGQQIGGEITSTTADTKTYVIKAPGLTAGDHKLGVTFLNDVYKEGEYDLNFYIQDVTVRPAK